MSKPKIVCLCGSTKFKKELVAENRRLTLEGKIVLTVGFFGHLDEEFDMTDQFSRKIKCQLDELHFHKIRMADRVHVINKGGYIGDSTRAEIAFAKGAEKPITYYERLK